MGRHSCSPKLKLRKGLWSPEEDEKLCDYISRFGVGCWSSIPHKAGLQRCGKSCRLRWINYLRPDLKRGMLSQEEEDLIVNLHKALGNRWAQIAAQLPGRTDNEIKNYWNSYLKKKLMKQGIDPATHKPLISELEEDQKNINSPQTSSSSLPRTPPSMIPLPTLKPPEQPFPAKYPSSFMNHGGPTIFDFQPLFEYPIFAHNSSLTMPHKYYYHQNCSPDGPLQAALNIEPAAATHDQGDGSNIIPYLPPQFHLPALLANLDNGNETFVDAEYISDNSAATTTMVHPAKESSTSSSSSSSMMNWDMVVNNRMESLLQYSHGMMNGVKVEEDQELPLPWQEEQVCQHSLDDFSYLFQQNMWKL